MAIADSQIYKSFPYFVSRRKFYEKACTRCPSSPITAFGVLPVADLPTALKAIQGLDNLDSSGGLPIDEVDEK